jgi:molybdenum cofactor guanylyltransferase
MTGIVLCGGLSSRLGYDKMIIQKENQPMFQYWNNILCTICSNVFISCTKDQKIKYKIENTIQDDELNQGPLAGIVSGIKIYPSTPLFVVACDLVYLNKQDLTALISLRNENKMATCYKNYENNLPFPLFTIYEPNIFKLLIDEFQFGRKSALDVLLKNEINLIERKINLKGINTGQELLDYQNNELNSA